MCVIQCYVYHLAVIPAAASASGEVFAVAVASSLVGVAPLPSAEEVAAEDAGTYTSAAVAAEPTSVHVAVVAVVSS